MKRPSQRKKLLLSAHLSFIWLFSLLLVFPLAILQSIKAVFRVVTMLSLTHILPLALAAASGASASPTTIQKRDISYPGVLGFLVRNRSNDQVLEKC